MGMKIFLSMVCVAFYAGVFFVNPPARADNQRPHAGNQQSEIKILEYDKSGRATRIKRLKPKSQRRSSGTREFMPDNRYVEGELLILNPRRGFERAVRKLGYKVIEKATLKGLKLGVYRLRIPNKMTVAQAKVCGPELRLTFSHCTLSCG